MTAASKMSEPGIHPRHGARFSLGMLDIGPALRALGIRAASIKGDLC